MTHFKLKVMVINFASLKLTFVLLLSLLAAIIGAYYANLSYVSVLTLPFLLLLLNLIAAIVTNKAFQSNLPLLFFHLTLLATVVLVALSRLTYLDGRVALNEGEVFTGQLDEYVSGVLHDYRLSSGDFTNLAVQLDFTPMVAVTGVRSRVALNSDAADEEFVVGEHNPLVIKNYRFYVTRNVGYSAMLSWQSLSNNSSEETGLVSFPPFLENQYNQTNTWKIPQSNKELWFMLQPKTDILAVQQSTQLLPMDNQLVVRIDNNIRQPLRVGQQLQFSEGVLTYHGLRTWIGFTVHYDPYKAYLLMTSILTVLCLSWFFWKKFTRNSWLAPLPQT